MGRVKNQYASTEPGARTGGLTSGIVWLLILAGVVSLLVSRGIVRAPYITNDGYQYLDAASNLASGRCLCTYVALFDEQVAFGRMPVPFTHFGPGYPILMAALSRTGLTPEAAGYLLSAAGFIGVIWLMWDIGLGLGARPWIVAAFCCLWIVQPDAVLFGSTIGTESLFAAMILAMVALIVRDLNAPGPRPPGLIAIGAIAGASYWVRYPGLFVAAAAGLYLLVRAWRSRGARTPALAGILAGAVLIAAVQIRNAVYTGSWRGGFRNAGGRTTMGHAAAAAADTVRAFVHFVAGDRAPLYPNLWFCLLAASLAGLVVLGWQSWRRRKWNLAGAGLIWTMLIAFIYMAGVFAATLLTIAADLPRYYFPVYPLFLLLAAAVCSAIAPGKKGLAVLLLVVSVVAVERRSFVTAPPDSDWVVARAFLTENVQDGTTLSEWLRSHVTPQRGLLAVEGQAVHYVVHRPVFAIIPARFSAFSWDERGMRALMMRTHSRYLLVFANLPPGRAPEQTTSAFLSSLAAGSFPPWLKLATHTSDAAVYECGDCAA